MLLRQLNKVAGGKGKKMDWLGDCLGEITGVKRTRIKKYKV